MKDNNIGWAWWPHKKISSIAGPLSAEIAPGYQYLLDYWNGNGSKPSVDYAYDALMNQAYKLRFENCKFQRDVIDAMFRQPEDDSVLPFKEHKATGKIFAVDYDLGRRGSAYNDAEYQNTQGNGGPPWNNGWLYRNDGVDIEKCEDDTTNGYNVGWIESGEYLKFTVDVEIGGTFNLILRYAANSSTGQIRIAVDNQFASGVTSLPMTGGWQIWNSITIEDIELTTGPHEVITKFLNGGFNLNYFEFIQTVVGVEDEVVLQEFSLNQNYPNPFNPETIIEYTVGKKQNVKLIVYDILGNEVATLVNELKVPGTYTVKFKAESLSSGIYLYKIISGDFSNIKKMLLIK